MAAFSEFVFFVLSIGALNPWLDEGDSKQKVDPVYQRNEIEMPTESKSLYDLMAHFPTDKDITCPGSDSRFRYPGECRRYITCRNYQAHIRTCPPGMSFDQDAKQCRLAFEVQCEELTAVQEKCSVHEVYSECGCDTTCGDPRMDSECPNGCERGCFCQSGYVRDDSGNCVNEDVCQGENSLLSIFENY